MFFNNYLLPVKWYIFSAFSEVYWSFCFGITRKSVGNVSSVLHTQRRSILHSSIVKALSTFYAVLFKQSVFATFSSTVCEA